MNYQFEKFIDKHIEEAVQLALKELETERVFCSELPVSDFEERLKQILWWLGSQPYGKAALCDGKLVGLLDDTKVYLGYQVEKQGSDRCYGLVADQQYLLVCEYGCNGADAEIVVYKRR